ncbi:MAG: hypothetical protein ABI411_07050 [Tahibacter sp.]
MTTHRRMFVGLILLGIAANWLLLAGPKQLLGIDTGNAGVFLLIAVAWLSLIAISRLPLGNVDRDISPGEWRAWIGCGFAAAILAYSLLHAAAFQAPSLWQNPDANRVGRNIAMLVIAWFVLLSVLQTRWRRGVEEDERDRAIACRAVEWARISLVVYIVGIAVLFSFSPNERLTWAPPPMIGHLLIVGLIVSSLVEYAVTALAYRRDRV